MSKVVAMIRAVDSGKRSIPPETFMAVNCDSQEVYYPSALVHYRVQAIFGAEVAVPSGQGDLDVAVKHVKDAIIEAVFGEFRKPIHELRAALYHHDYKLAHDLLDALLAQMFTEGK